MRNRPKPQEVYRHFKGNSYEILGIAKHSETEEELVIYKALYGEGQIYARPIGNFLDEVDCKKYPDSIQRYRFEEVQQKEEELNIDPMVMEFLDASTYEERLNILDRLKNRITDDMITMMAIACDIEIKEGEVDERYQELKRCLITFEKYECNRLR